MELKTENFYHLCVETDVVQFCAHLAEFVKIIPNREFFKSKIFIKNDYTIAWIEISITFFPAKIPPS